MGYDPTKGVPELRDWEAMYRHWEHQGELGSRRNGERYLTDAKAGNRTMREQADGSISILYKKEHLITYHMDGAVSVSALSSQANADPAGQVFPKWLMWGLGTKTGPCVFSAPNDLKDNHAWWWLRRNREVAPKCLVVRARHDRPVRMHLVDNRWEPIDLDSLEPFRWITYDTKAARGASETQGIPDFVSALDAYLAMGCDMPEPEKGVTDAELLCRLRARDFAGVMAGLPRNVRYAPWVAGQPTKIAGFQVKPSAIVKLRTQAIVEAGATIIKEQRLLTLPEWLNVETQLKRFGKPE